jgi:hypothetical protein
MKLTFYIVMCGHDRYCYTDEIDRSIAGQIKSECFALLLWDAYCVALLRYHTD